LDSSLTCVPNQRGIHVFFLFFQQKAYNPFFSLVLRRLCVLPGSHGKKYRFTLQLCVFDALKTLADKVPTNQMLFAVGCQTCFVISFVFAVAVLGQRAQGGKRSKACA